MHVRSDSNGRDVFIAVQPEDFSRNSSFFVRKAPTNYVSRYVL